MPGHIFKIFKLLLMLITIACSNGGEKKNKPDSGQIFQVEKHQVMEVVGLAI